MGKRISIKNSMRSLKRLIAKLPEGSEKRVKLERSLAELENRRQGVQRVEKEKKNAKRYRGTRFVERVKLTRKLKQLERNLGTIGAAEEREKLEEDIDKVKRDLLYIKHFPNSEKYISILLPTTEESASHIQRIRSEIESKLREEAIVAEADEGASMKGKQFSKSPESGDEDAEGVSEEQDDFFLGEGEEGGELPTTTGVVSFELEPEEQQQGGDLQQEEEEEEEEEEEASELQQRHHYRDNPQSQSKSRRPSSSKFMSPKRFTNGGVGGDMKSKVRGKSRTEGEKSQRTRETKAPVDHSSDDKQPKRTRAEGGRKRRRKK